MDDIHSPTLPSGPTTNGYTNGVNRNEISLLDLISEKDRVENELKALSSVLDSHRVNMNTSLTTFDGYPRDDIDVAQIRTTRARIIHLRNDYKDLMKRIEAGLHAHHAAMASSDQLESMTLSPDFRSQGRAAVPNNTEAPGEVPFAKVNSVIAGSPAEVAGLKIGDRILKFGVVDWSNHDKLSKVAETVSHNEGVAYEEAI